LLLGFFVAYLGILLWVVPRRVPVLSDPLIDAALTAQPTRPPLPRLVVVDRSPQDTQYCVKPGDTVLLRIEPTPDPTKPAYLVDDLWTGIHLEQRSWWEWQFKVEGKKPGDYFVLMLYEVNEKGERGYGISRATFSVQEGCK